MKPVFLVIFLLELLQGSSQFSVDTVLIVDSIHVPMPQRMCVAQDIDMGYLDSIRAGNRLINKSSQFYYLKVFNADSLLSWEGDFFDQYPSGILLRRNKYGLLVDSLSYSLIKLKKSKKEICKWKSLQNSRDNFIFKYNTYYKSILEFPQVHNDYKKEKLIRKTVITPENKTITEYDSKGEIREVFFYDKKDKLVKTR